MPGASRDEILSPDLFDAISVDGLTLLGVPFYQLFIRELGYREAACEQQDCRFYGDQRSRLVICACNMEDEKGAFLLVSMILYSSRIY